MAWNVQDQVLPHQSVTCMVVMTGTPAMISVLVETCLLGAGTSWEVSAPVARLSLFFGT